MPTSDDTGEARGRALVEAALTLFSRYGYKRTSVDDIAREARVAKGTVYLSFESKEHLFRAASERIVERALAAAAAARDAKGPVEARLFGMLDARFTYFFELARGAPHAGELLDPEGGPSADLVRHGDRRYQALVAELLAAANGSGELHLSRAALSPAAAAALLFRSAHGSGLPEPTGAAPSVHAYRRRLTEVVRIHVFGFGGTPRGTG